MSVVNCIFDTIKANPASASVIGMMAVNAFSGALPKPGTFQLTWRTAPGVAYKFFYDFVLLLISAKTGHAPPDPPSGSATFPKGA